MPDTEDKKPIIFPVSVLHIQLNTNTGPKGERNIQLFKRSMIKMPKIDIPPVLTSEYPLFTKYVRYPKSIERADWKTKYEFFFNREIFMDNLRKEIDKNSDIYRERITSKDVGEMDKLYEWMQTTEKHNIMITLRSIFPIPESFGKILKNSYEHILKNATNSRVIMDIDIQNSINFFGFMYKFGMANKDKEEYFINIGGKRYTVDDVIWENDLVNHPIYKEFLISQRETGANSVIDVNEKYSAYLEKLNDSLNEMKLMEQFHSEFFTYSEYCKNRMIAGKLCDDKQMYIFFTGSIKNANNNDIMQNYIRQNNELNIQMKYLMQKYYLNTEYENYISNKKNTTPQEKRLIDILAKNNVDFKNMKVSKFDDITANQDEIRRIWRDSLDAIFKLNTIGDNNDTVEKVENALLDKMIADLKTDTFFMIRQHILEKANTIIQDRQKSKSHSDRISIANSVADKIKRVSSELGESAADIIISIKDSFDNHKQMYSNEGVNVFMEKSDEVIFERFLKMSIEIKAASIVLKFAKNNVSINLNDKNADGTEVSNVNKLINKFIREENFGTEANISNKLSTNLKNVFEPVRKTSNRELYKVLKLFNYGDAVMRKEYKMSKSEVTEYKQIFDKIYDKYVLDKRVKDDDLDTFLYTGIDEVKTSSEEEKDAKNTKSVIKQNVNEIYVYISLVNADTLEKVNRSSCKLFDKEMEQEFMHLAEPNNKNNTTVSKYRDFDIEATKESVTNKNETEANANANANVNANANKPDTKDQVKGGGKSGSRRLRIRFNQKRKTIRR